MMDCDTTGLEPDLALVKFKKLVGGGSMQIVNQTVPRALRALGYQEEQVEAIVEHIAAHGNVVDAPGLKREHYEVFDCAMGERSISPMGHVKMMAAIQPFVSGALSKTVNLPAEATVDDVADVYFQGWKLGLKALAIYRNNSKVGQPLSSKKDSEKGASSDEDVVVATRPTRKRLPKKRRSQTVSFAVAGAEGYMTAGEYDDGTLGEVFIKMSKQGSTLAGVMDAFSVSISIGLQYGVPLEAFVSKYINMRFDPAGMTDDADIRIAQSVMDYLFRRLALDYLPFETRSEMGIFSAEERAAAVAGGSYGGSNDSPSDVDVEALAQSVPVACSSSAGCGSFGSGRCCRVVDGAARGDAGDGCGRSAVHDVRDEDAAGGELLRVRGVWEHQRLQLITGTWEGRRSRPAPLPRSSTATPLRVRLSGWCGCLPGPVHGGARGRRRTGGSATAHEAGARRGEMTSRSSPATSEQGNDVGRTPSTRSILRSLRR